ncbi:hypothetical protein KEM48_009876 [Puccinia striiformis f. sp. tritici PST-130]|nr:hypothetical protein KEM48_009876 [Puccinia striiformis f. sp. tritici PST-130]
MALNCLLWTIKFKKSKIASMDLIKPIVDSLITIGAEDEPEDPEDDSVARTAFRCLDTLSTSLSPQAVFPALFARIQECFASPDPTLRKAAVMALGVTVEGCSLFIQPHIDQLWPFIDSGLEDSDPRVRRAACTALSCICEMLVDECASRHQTLVPRVSALLNDPACQRNAMTALDGLLEVLDDQTIGLYLNPSWNACAFEPYFDVCMQHITPFLSLKAEGEEQELRGVAQDTVGTLASAVGKEKFRPFLDACLNIAFEAIDLNSPSLRECSMIFFGTLAKVYESEFVTYLPRVMPAVFASLGQAEEDDGSVLTSEMIKGFQPADDEEDEAEEDPNFVDIDDVDLDDDDLMKTTTAIAVEKSVAADAVSELFEYTRTHFLPYLEQSIKSLAPLLAHFYPTTRKAAATTLLSFITVAHEITNPPKFEPGIANIHMPGDVRKLVDLIMPEIMVVWRSEDECDVVSDLCSSLSSVISTVGAGMVAPAYLDETCSLIIAILERKSPAQLDGDFDDASATGDLSEVESSLIGCAADLVGTYATVLGADFAQAFGQFLPCMAKSMIHASHRPIGTMRLALWQRSLTATKDEDVEVRSNAAFFVGSLAYWTPVDISSQYLSILECLQPLFTVLDDPSREKSERAKDNAAGAIARMILKNKAALPLDQDFAESSKCFEALFELIQQSHPLVEAHFEHILAVFAHVLQNSVPAVSEEKAMIPAETRDQLVTLLRQLNTRVPDQLAACGLTQFLS